MATSTSAFGVSRREGHDASAFYARFAPPLVSDDSLVAASGRDIDRIFCGDARSMVQVPDRSVALVVTSPPYFAGKEYEAALGEGAVPASYVEYLGMLEDVFAECVRKLEPGGRIAVNVANLGRKPYRSLSADVIQILQDKLQLLLRGEIIWQKGKGAAGNCAWGSFQSPANPVLRDLTERVVVASRGRFDRVRRRDAETSLTRDHFMAITTDVWEIAPESARRVGHPAPFPVELPERLIHLYTYIDDLVLDPFMGVGTTAVAAVRTGRHYAGYDTDPEYVEAAARRVEGEIATPSTGDGRTVKDVARDFLASAGFVDIRPGKTVAFRAIDAEGQMWNVELCGAFTSARPGLRRADNLWKTIGKAAVLHASDPTTPLMVLTTELPDAGSPGEAALRAVTGPGKPIASVAHLRPTDGVRVDKGFDVVQDVNGCSPAQLFPCPGRSFA